MELRRSINPNIFIVYRRAIVMSVCRTPLITLPTNLKTFDNLYKIHARISHATFLTFQFPATNYSKTVRCFRGSVQKNMEA